MIERLTGQLLRVTDQEAVVAVGGVGYRLALPPVTARSLAERRGEEVTLYTVHYIQGAVGVGSLMPILVGFQQPHHRDFYETLLQVDGLGPKAALRLLSEPVEAIAAAIEGQDIQFLKGLPGIGKQKAADLVRRLQGKVTRFLPEVHGAGGAAADPLPVPAGAAGDGNEVAEEVLEVLLQLGYPVREAQRMVARATARLPAAGAEELVQEIFRRAAGDATGGPGNAAGDRQTGEDHAGGEVAR